MHDSYKWARDEVGALLAAKLQAMPQSTTHPLILGAAVIGTWLSVTAIAALRVLLIWLVAVLFGLTALTLSPFVMLYVLVDMVWMTTWFVVKAFQRMRK